MKALTIQYARLVNTGNWSHEKYGIELEVEEDETAQEVLDQAKAFVARQLKGPTPVERAIAEKVCTFDEDDDIPF